MKEIDRCTQKSIDPVRGETVKSVSVNCAATAPVARWSVGKVAVATACPTALHPLAWRVRQVIRRQVVCLLQFRVQIFECRRQFRFNPLTRLPFFAGGKKRDWISKCDPNRRTPKRKPTSG